MKPTTIVKGLSSQRKVIVPFQYYSDINETIYCLTYAEHWGITKLFLHYDSQQRLIAKTLATDEADEAIISYLKHEFEPEQDWLNQQGCTSIEFQDILLEMHLACSNQKAPLYKEHDLDFLVGMFPKPPIIIGGCGRSGTSLLLSILGSHSSILAIPDETYTFYPMPFRLRRLIHMIELLSQKKRQPNPLRWCEKTPKNVRAFGTILSAFKNKVRLIHIVRDGRDVVTSVHPLHPRRYWISIERWLADVTSGLKHDALLVRYEDLILEPEKTLGQICAYIEEPFDPKMLHFSSYSQVKEHVAWGSQKVRPLDRNRVGKWKAYEHTAKINEFMTNRQAVTLMQKLNYL